MAVNPLFMSLSMVLACNNVRGKSMSIHPSGWTLVTSSRSALSCSSPLGPPAPLPLGGGAFPFAFGSAPALAASSSASCSRISFSLRMLALISSSLACSDLLSGWNVSLSFYMKRFTRRESSVTRPVRSVGRSPPSPMNFLIWWPISLYSLVSRPA